MLVGGKSIKGDSKMRVHVRHGLLLALAAARALTVWDAAPRGLAWRASIGARQAAAGTFLQRGCCAPPASPQVWAPVGTTRAGTRAPHEVEFKMASPVDILGTNAMDAKFEFKQDNPKRCPSASYDRYEGYKAATGSASGCPA